MRPLPQPQMKPWAYSKPTTPILLSSSVSLLQGRSGTPDVAALSNVFREPLIIDEVRFAIYNPDPLNSGDLSGTTTCRFRMGRVELSPKDIPISLYGTSMQQYSIESSSVIDNPDTVVTYRHWKLPVPLFIPAGSTLVPTFRRAQHPTSTTAVTYQIAYAGRYVNPSEPLPPRIQVPYVNAFYPNLDQFYAAGAPTGEVVYSTGELDLANLLDVPVRVQRFVGRMYQYQSPGTSELADVGANGGFVGPYFVEMKDSYGRDVVKDPTTFSTVFEIERRNWTYSKILGPRERYLMKIYNTALPLVPQMPMVSIVGWREEVFK